MDPHQKHDRLDYGILLAFLSVLVFGLVVMLGGGLQSGAFRPDRDTHAALPGQTYAQTPVRIDDGRAFYDARDWEEVRPASVEASGVLPMLHAEEPYVRMALVPATSEQEAERARVWSAVAVKRPEAVVLVTADATGTQTADAVSANGVWTLPNGTAETHADLFAALEQAGSVTSDPQALQGDSGLAAFLSFATARFPGVPVLAVRLRAGLDEDAARAFADALRARLPESAAVAIEGTAADGTAASGVLFDTLARALRCARTAADATRGQLCQDRTEGEAVISAVGDVMLSRAVGNALSRTDVNDAFADAADVLAGSDFAFANLESVLSERQADCGAGYCFKARPQYVSALLKMGLTQVSVANNHMVDYGEEPWHDSVDVLVQQGIDPVGDLANDAVPAIREFEGKRYAFLAFETLIRPIETEAILEKVRAAADQSDVLIVSFHWGEEYQHTPRQQEIDLAHAVVDAGADVLIGHHPHVLQTIEPYHGALIFYSLGNFVFDQDGFDENETLVARLYLGDERRVELLPMRIDGYFPRPAGAQETAVTLQRLATWSAPSLRDQILSGEIVFRALSE